MGPDDSQYTVDEQQQPGEEQDTTEERDTKASDLKTEREGKASDLETERSDRAEGLETKRTGRAGVLAEDVKDREYFERRTTLIILGAALFLFVSSFSSLAYGLKKVGDVAERNTKIVCGLKSGYQEDLKNAKEFSLANPNGGTILGVTFTHEDLAQRISGLETRLSDIKDAKC